MHTSGVLRRAQRNGQTPENNAVEVFKHWKTFWATEQLQCLNCCIDLLDTHFILLLELKKHEETRGGHYWLYINYIYSFQVLLHWAEAVLWSHIQMRFGSSCSKSNKFPLFGRSLWFCHYCHRSEEDKIQMPAWTETVRLQMLLWKHGR